MTGAIDNDGDAGAWTGATSDTSRGGGVGAGGGEGAAAVVGVFSAISGLRWPRGNDTIKTISLSS